MVESQDAGMPSVTIDSNCIVKAWNNFIKGSGEKDWPNLCWKWVESVCKTKDKETVHLKQKFFIDKI